MGQRAQRVYLNEEGVKLKDLQEDLDNLIRGFKKGKRLGLLIRNENAHPTYTTDFISALLDAEGGDLFDVRQAILGHLQQGGNPSPFDRIQATRLATLSMDYLIDHAITKSIDSAFIGLQGKELKFHNLEDFPRLIDEDHQRPRDQWWLDIRPILKVLAQPGSKI